MKIDIICSDPNHPVRSWLERWAEEFRGAHDVAIVEQASQCNGGDLLFMISCNEMIEAGIRDSYGRALVIHASDLPEGRGWSPMIWQVLEGRNKITLTLFEATDRVDEGAVIRKACFSLCGDELYDEINAHLFDAEMKLMDFAVQNFPALSPVLQVGSNATYYEKRTPENSRIDPEKTISSQFNLLRVADPIRYPAFFEWKGCRYKLVLEKMDSDPRDK